jgi:hypothetical protein
MYGAYQGTSSALLSCFKVLRMRPSDHVLYHAWRDVDRQFIADLRRIAARDGYEVLRGEVTAVGHGEGVRRDLTDLDTTPTER